MKNLSNKLVAYHGGGYSGCIWEWNYAYIDPEGGFLSLYHSGANGCDTMEKLLEALDRDDTYVYSLDSQETLEEFSESHNPSDVLALYIEYQPERSREVFRLFPDHVDVVLRRHPDKRQTSIIETA